MYWLSAGCADSTRSGPGPTARRCLRPMPRGCQAARRREPAFSTRPPATILAPTCGPTSCSVRSAAGLRTCSSSPCPMSAIPRTCCCPRTSSSSAAAAWPTCSPSGGCMAWTRSCAKAWRAGIVLSGVSAGAICWFTSGTTDSFGADLRPFTGGLGLLAPSYCPHYDSEPGSRPLYQSLVAGGSLPPGIACDDGAAAHFVDDSLAEIVADRPEARGYSGGQRQNRQSWSRLLLESRLLLAESAQRAAGANDRYRRQASTDVGTAGRKPTRSSAVRRFHAMLTVHNFSYGLLTPGLGYLMSVVGCFSRACAARAGPGRAPAPPGSAGCWWRRCPSASPGSG